MMMEIVSAWIIQLFVGTPDLVISLAWQTTQSGDDSLQPMWY